jgi:hypothetical protein
MRKHQTRNDFMLDGSGKHGDGVIVLGKRVDFCVLF